MCGICGCGEGEVRIDQKVGTHERSGHHHHHHAHHHGDHDHAHAHVHEHGPGHDHARGRPAHAHAPGLDPARAVQVERDLLARNDALARVNRRRLREAGVLALNLVSSPGAGKTTLLVETLKALKDRGLPLAVIEGDQETANDAERIRATGVPAVQVNTGKGCHLDAHMVGHAMERLDLASGGLLFIENVGNLVCPAAFDLGEARRIVILSVTEGDDKPQKYPDMFAGADLMIVSKTDLLPYVDFDVARCVALARHVNPGLQVIGVSARTGEGMTAWLDWLLATQRAHAIDMAGLPRPAAAERDAAGRKQASDAALGETAVAAGTAGR